MRAVISDGNGGLVVVDRPDPEPGPGEVLIEVMAAGVNRADVLQRQGHYAPPPGAADVLGLECSGRIAAIGPPSSGGGAAAEGSSPPPSRFEIGDEVCALLGGGGYASMVAVPAAQVLPRPSMVSLVDAAGLPETSSTVWSNLAMIAHLRAGETLLVHGGASGIGTTAIQLGKALGATVLVTVGSERKAEFCLELGADAAIRYDLADFVSSVRQKTASHGADVVLDIVGGPYLERNVDALATNGRLVVIGLQQGRRGELDLGALLAKRAAVIATTLRGRPVQEKAAIVSAVGEYVWPLIEDGRFRPVIDRVLPLDDVTEAHRVMEGSEHIGKILLTP